MLADALGKILEVILIASGSEVSLAVQAHEKLDAEEIRSRVVSMPSWTSSSTSRIPGQRFAASRKSALPSNSLDFWMGAHVGDAGRVIGMETFGASAPLKELQNKFGFEPDGS